MKTVRFLLASFLVLALNLSGTSFALRPAGLEESPPALKEDVKQTLLTAGLEEEHKVVLNGSLPPSKMLEEIQLQILENKKLDIPLALHPVMKNALVEMLEDIHRYGYASNDKYETTLAVRRESDQVVVEIFDQSLRYRLEALKDPAPKPFFYKTRIETEPDYERLLRQSEIGERGGWGFPKLFGYYEKKQLRVHSETEIPRVGVRTILVFPIPPALPPPTKTGLEEVEWTMAALAQAVPERRALVISASVISQRTGLEEFISRLPKEMGTILIYDTQSAAAAKELAARNDKVILVDSDKMIDVAVTLAGLEEASQIGFIGPLTDGRTLGRILPSSMAVTLLDPRVALNDLLLFLQIPWDLLQELNTAGLEEKLALRHAA